MKHTIAFAPLIVAVVFPLFSVQACGPDFSPDIFVYRLHPDDHRDYAAGKLGVLLPTYLRMDLAVAYRYLSGGTLAAEEQRAYALQGAPQGVNDGEPSAAEVWHTARARYAKPAPVVDASRELRVQRPDNSQFSADYLNCAPPAFTQAAETLKSRAAAWGDHSLILQNWLAGQDAVFANCHGGAAVMPGAVPPDAPLLLRQDRAYQLAAAEFYAAQFATARRSFATIAADKGSPWCGISAYLVARTLVREAFLSPKTDLDNTPATFDPVLMKQAQHQLEAIRHQDLPGLSPRAVDGLLHLVKLRTEPKERIAEISEALAGPKVDSNYQQDLIDMTWYLDGKLDEMPIRADAEDSELAANDSHNSRPLAIEQRMKGYDKAFMESLEVRSASRLVDWMVTFQSPAESARSHALEEWRRTHQVPWLIAAIAKARADDPETPALIDAAGRIRSVSPAWLTVTYHRERLLSETGHAGQAALEIEAIMPMIPKIGGQSALNEFTAVHMRTATALNQALADAPRRILERTSEEAWSLGECLAVMHDPRRKYDCKPDTNPLEFSSDAAAMLNRELPLAELAHAAQSKELPPNLRQSVAAVAWVRAVMLKNSNVAAQVLPLLPQKLQQQAGPGVGFRPLMAILRNPGLRPYLDGGVQRFASWDFVDSYADNWWCGDWTSGDDNDSGKPIPAFLSAQAQHASAEQRTALLGMGGAEEFLGGQVIEYARTHPNDPDVPEALYLTLRMIRYGCYHGRSSYGQESGSTDKVGTIAYSVGALMRRRYAENPWTKKAAPYVWPVKKSETK